MEVINRTTNGMLAYCAKCHSYHLEFGNFFFQFTEEELDGFKDYLDKVNGEYYEQLNRDTPNNRKIFLRLPVRCVYVTLYLSELYELRALVHCLEESVSTNDCMHRTEAGAFCMN